MFAGVICVLFCGAGDWVPEWFWLVLFGGAGDWAPEWFWLVFELATVAGSIGLFNNDSWLFVNVKPSEVKRETTFSTECLRVKLVLFGCTGVWDGFGVLFGIGTWFLVGLELLTSVWALRRVLLEESREELRGWWLVDAKFSFGLSVGDWKEFLLNRVVKLGFCSCSLSLITRNLFGLIINE